jgi:hypothetical protein
MSSAAASFSNIATVGDNRPVSMRWTVLHVTPARRASERRDSPRCSRHSPSLTIMIPLIVGFYAYDVTTTASETSRASPSPSLYGDAPDSPTGPGDIRANHDPLGQDTAHQPNRDAGLQGATR